MPLSMANVGEKTLVKKIGGSPEIKRFLETLGFTVGTAIAVVAKTGENVIVSVKDSRIAISREMARRIQV